MRGRLTWIEKNITKQKEKEGITPSEQREVKRLKEQTKEREREFEQRHVDTSPQFHRSRK